MFINAGARLLCTLDGWKSRSYTVFFSLNWTTKKTSVLQSPTRSSRTLATSASTSMCSIPYLKALRVQYGTRTKTTLSLLTSCSRTTFSKTCSKTWTMWSRSRTDTQSTSTSTWRKSYPISNGTSSSPSRKSHTSTTCWTLASAQRQNQRNTKMICAELGRVCALPSTAGKARKRMSM